MYRIDFQENLYDGLKKIDMSTPKGKVIKFLCNLIKGYRKRISFSFFLVN